MQSVANERIAAADAAESSRWCHTRRMSGEGATTQGRES